MLVCLFGHQYLILSIRFNLALFYPDINSLCPLLGSHWSQRLAFKLLLQDTSLCGSPHMQCTAWGEEEEKDEGYGKAHSVHHTSSQGTKTQFPQDLQSGQKTVVGGLKIDRQREANIERVLALTFGNLGDLLKNSEKGTVNYKERGMCFAVRLDSDVRHVCNCHLFTDLYFLKMFSDPGSALNYKRDIYIKDAPIFKNWPITQNIFSMLWPKTNKWLILQFYTILPK